MATYVPGVGSYLPDFKPFTPDYKFLSNVLDTKTQKYESNYKALNDLYGKVVYGNLSRKDTQEMRDQYAENLAPKLQQIAGMDLSMAQNVEAAKGLFRPFFEEDIIVKDLAYTKKYRNEMQYTDMLKNSSIKEERDKYWQTGVQKMQYEMEDFVNSTEESALKTPMPTYTANANLYEMAHKYLTESELGTDVVTTVSENGEWMVHRKNGDLITNQALTLVQKAMKDDPLVVNAYHADAFVKSRQHADQGIESGIFSNVDEGQYDWAVNKITEVEAEIEKRKAAVEERKNALKNKNVAWEKTSSQNGVIKGSKEEKLKNENKSDLDALKQRLEEMNLLYDDQPDSEKVFKQTGEYKPENTKSLLYRAYSLMMNSAMETDLQAAALDYSKKDMMVKLEANPYATMAKKHNYDLDKMYKQFDIDKEKMRLKDIYNKENIALEASLASTGSDLLKGALLSGLGGNVVTNDLNTLTGKFDEDGNLMVDDDFNYLSSEEQVIAGLTSDLTLGEVDWTINMLERTQGQSNNGSGLIKMGNLEPMSASELQLELMDENGAIKEKYKETFNNTYSNMQNMITNIDVEAEAWGDGSPLLLNSQDPIGDFSEMQKGMDALREQRMAIEHQVNKLYSVSKENVDLAINSEFDLENGNEFKALMAEAVNAGMPTMFYEEGGVTKKYSEDEYKAAYKNWINTAEARRLGLSVEGVYVEGFDDRGIFKGDEHEQSWSDASNRMANLGEGAALSAQYKVSDPWAGYGGNKPTNNVSEYNGPMMFSKERSDQQASAFYNSMNELNNLAVRGRLEYDHAAVTDSKGDLADAGQIYKTWSVDAGMRGVDAANMTAGEIFNNPTYEIMLDPLNVTKEAADLLKVADNAVTSNETKAIMLHQKGFNRMQEGETKQDDDVEILNKAGEMGGLDEDNHTYGKILYDQYIMDLTKRRTTESKAQGNYPIAKIKYFPSWSSDGDELNSPYAGYTITLSEEYMKGLRGSGGALEGRKDLGNVISIVVDKDKDKNPRKYGEFNFSYVSSEIATSDDASFKKGVPEGGSFSISQGLGGQYNINYEILQFDNTDGSFKSATFAKPLLDQYDNPITQSNRNELDFYMRKYLYELEKIGKQNHKTRSAYKKANPNKLIKEPKYSFASN
jgi:hypothetical protein